VKNLIILIYDVKLGNRGFRVEIVPQNPISVNKIILFTLYISIPIIMYLNGM
jgi:hypothetical protein